jgi:hypothetical protein
MRIGTGGKIHRRGEAALTVAEEKADGRATAAQTGVRGREIKIAVPVEIGRGDAPGRV